MQVGMIWTQERISRLPVIDEQLTLGTIQEPVLIHPRRHAPTTSEWDGFWYLTDRDNVRDVKEQPSWPA